MLVISILNSLLKVIPLDGWKTVLGFVLLLLQGLVPAAPEFEPLRQVLEILGISIGSVGITHKVVKAVDQQP